VDELPIIRSNSKQESPEATRVERRAKQAHNLELGCRKVRFPSSCGMHGAIC
jgi:hypothetical protein